MKRNSLTSTIVLMMFALSCNNPSSEDKLAERLSQSRSFIELEQSSLKMADEIKKAKMDTTLVNKYKNLDAVSRRDSMLKSLYHSDTFTNSSLKMAEAAKKVSQEFPELEKLPKDAKKRVWRKSASIILANQPVK